MERARTISRRTVLSLLGGFGLGLCGSGAIGAAWIRSDHRPSITVLGCGRGLSALLSAGGARLLVVQGTSRADFGNALADARFPLLDRTDLLLLPGPTVNLAVAESAIRRSNARHIFSIGSANRLLDAGLSTERVLTAPHRFELPLETTATLAVRQSREVGPDAFSWSLEIERLDYRVILDSGDGAEELSSVNRKASVWLRAQGEVSAEILETARPAALFVSAEAMDGPALRGLLEESGLSTTYGYRVHGGEVARIELTTDGARLPGDPVNELSARGD